MVFLIPLMILFATFALALWLGTPHAPPPLESVVGPFKGMDISGLPPQEFIQARDGTPLAFRRYRAASGNTLGSVTLVHGSSSRNHSFHPLAHGLSQAGWDIFSPDIRGHGDSGKRGQIGYIGQLEDDLEDFLRQASPVGRKILAGFSSGGGFALRVAGGPKRDLFDGYLLLSPFLHQDSPACRKNSGGWVGLGLPRIIALTLLNRMGVTALNGLSVMAFALPERDKKFMTPEYSFALMSNFRPRDCYRADIRNAGRPMRILAGGNDEVFRAGEFAGEFEKAGGTARVTLVPGLSHVGLTLDPEGIGAIAGALRDL